MKKKLFKSGIAKIKITYTKDSYGKFKNLAKSFNKAQEISGKMCELRQEVIDKAQVWNKAWYADGTPNYFNSCRALLEAVERYETFRKKHFGEKK